MRSSSLLLGLLAASGLLLVGPVAAVGAMGSWRVGRATFYGTDAWSIHQGSCHYGYLWPDEPLGWDVAAISDVNWAYVGSCGRCMEVRCNPSDFTDGYGTPLDRISVCYNSDASVVVRTTDTCPCVYPGNSYSNRRWCCGDMDHLDMSVWAFEKLADKRWGVIGIQYRIVPCDYQPEVVAPALANPTPGQAPPAGAVPKNRGWNWQLTADGSVQVQWSSVPHDVYVNGPKPGWSLDTDASSSYTTTTQLGIRGGANAVCTTLSADAGHLDIASAIPAPFVGAGILELWAHKEQPFGEVPSVKLDLLTAKGASACPALALADLAPASGGGANSTSWARYVIAMPNFADTCTLPGLFNSTFSGCSGAPAEALTGLRFSNTLGAEQVVCLDGIRLISNIAA